MKCWIEHWRNEVAAQADALTGNTVADLRALAADPFSIARNMKFQPGYLADDEDRRASAGRLLGTALGDALHDCGWTAVGAIAEPLTFHKACETIEPIALIGLLAGDENARADWADRALSLEMRRSPWALALCPRPGG